MIRFATAAGPGEIAETGRNLQNEFHPMRIQKHIGWNCDWCARFGEKAGAR